MFPSRLLALAVVFSAIGYADLGRAADVSDPPVKAAVKPVPPVPFFTVVDDRLTYAYMPNGTDPGFARSTAKQVVAFTHFDAWAYGTNFANLALFKSDHSDPAAPCSPTGRKGCAGALDFAGSIRSTIGFNQVFNTSTFSVGPLHNVSLEVGADGKVENNALDPARLVGFAGLQFAFDLPYKGFFNVAPMYFKEVNYSAFLPAPLDGSLDFRGSWAVETNYYMDLGFLPDYLPLSISGRAAWYGPKGPGTSAPGTLNRVTEFSSEPIRLTLDASRAAGGAKYSHLLDVWVAYRYWQNKFGLDHNRAPQCIGLTAGSCTESSVFSGVTVKF
nr:hypothetical protein [Bradyrhizobium diazoefficiens]